MNLSELTEVLNEIEFFERERTDRQVVELAILLSNVGVNFRKVAHVFGVWNACLTQRCPPNEPNSSFDSSRSWVADSRIAVAVASDAVASSGVTSGIAPRRQDRK